VTHDHGIYVRKHAAARERSGTAAVPELRPALERARPLGGALVTGTNDQHAFLELPAGSVSRWATAWFADFPTRARHSTSGA
jgi:hypothetical protein